MIVTASADKTVSLFDLRSGLNTQTFYSHANAVNQARFNNSGELIASCDMDGICKVWDMRMVCERLQISAGMHAANAVCFDRSSQILCVASGDSTIKNFNLADQKFLNALEGHKDSVNCLDLEATGRYLVSGGGDNTFRVWQGGH